MAAWVIKTESLSMRGDNKGQAEAFKACLENAPRAVECLSKQLVLRARLGDCEAMRDDAKRLLSLNPRSSISHRQLAVALFATGAPRESVIEALSRSWSFRPDAEQKRTEIEDRATLATAEGDFLEAERLLLEWQKAVAEKSDQGSHAEPAVALAKLYFEMGSAKRAGEVAEALLRRMSAWTEVAVGTGR